LRRALLPLLLAVPAAALLLAGASSAAKPVRVGSVVTFTGKHIWIKRAGAHTLIVPRKGTPLYLGDTLVAGPGLKATLHFVVPRGLSPQITALIGIYKQLDPSKPPARLVIPTLGVQPQLVAADPTLLLERVGPSIFFMFRR
jgi:hypothetical protein